MLSNWNLPQLGVEDSMVDSSLFLTASPSPPPDWRGRSGTEKSGEESPILISVDGYTATGSDFFKMHWWILGISLPKCVDCVFPLPTLSGFPWSLWASSVMLPHLPGSPLRWDALPDDCSLVPFFRVSNFSPEPICFVLHTYVYCSQCDLFFLLHSWKEQL